MAPGEAILLARPLLGVRRATLRSYIKFSGVPFVDDPSNDDMSYERVRVRQGLEKDEAAETGISIESLARSARRLSDAARAAKQFEERMFTSRGGYFTSWGGAFFDLELKKNACETISKALLARLVRAVGGNEFVPSEEATEEALDAICAGRRTCLGGVMVHPLGMRVCIYREPAGVLGRASDAKQPEVSYLLPPQKRILWDRRFIVENRSDKPVRVEPFGSASAPLFAGLPDAVLAAPKLTYVGDQNTSLLSPVLQSKGPWRAIAEERFYEKVRRI